MHAHRLGAALLVTALAFTPSGGAVTVYRCVENGSIAYRQNATHPNCETLDILTEDPPAEAVASQREALDQQRARRLQARESRRQGTGTKKESGRATEQDSAPALPPIPRDLDFGDAPR